MLSWPVDAGVDVLELMERNKEKDESKGDERTVI